jgi:hypothetical protein
MEMLPWLEKLQTTEQGDEDALQGMAEFFVRLVADWDIVDNDDRKLAITEETYRRLPSNLVEAIQDGIANDRTMRASEKKAQSATLDAGLQPVDSSEAAQNGTGSSERRATWA